jgi:hypothetical protein
MIRFIRNSVTLLLLFGAGISYYGSSSNFLARIKGYDLYVQQDVIDFGECSSGKLLIANFHLINISGHDVLISGAKTPCDCLSFEPVLPITIRIGQEYPLKLMYRVPNEIGAFERSVHLWSETSMETVACLTVRGMVR